MSLQGLYGRGKEAEHQRGDRWGFHRWVVLPKELTTMSYNKCSIRHILADIDTKKIYLPALQRKFIWGKRQIELLFDSLMRDYPFGTFLFWNLDRKKAEHYVFYEFLTEYDEQSPYNRRKTGAFLHQEIIGVLDGQQRLSSMYIGLMGTHAERTRYGRVSDPNAYPKMSLYLNLLSLPYTIDANNRIHAEEEKNFEFCFLTEENAAAKVERAALAENGEPGGIEPMFWMKVGTVLSWDDTDPEFDRLIDGFCAQCRTEVQKQAFSEKRRLVRRGLEILHKRMFKDELINYFTVAKDDLEDILKIFVRVNSGGTILSKTDLLFSTIVATWDDGREEIERVLRTINGLGDGFSFGNEYLMRCCLVLSEGPVVYKVNSFKAENVQRIRDEWPKIAAAVIKTVELLAEFGFSGSLLTSQNATIILSYYIYKGGSLDKASKDAMKKYLVHALLNTIYGSSQEALIAALRKAFREEIKDESGNVTYRLRFPRFSFDELIKIELPQQKRLTVTEADIEQFLMSRKGPAAFFVLTLLYPNLRYNEVSFHQDHIHPASGFTEKNFEEMGIPVEQWQEWLNCRDCVPNLQLMEGRQNCSKNAAPFKIWHGQMDESQQAAFAVNNYLPPGVSLDFKDFMGFFALRKEMLRNAVRKVVALTSTPSPILPQSEVNDRDDDT